MDSEKLSALIDSYGTLSICQPCFDCGQLVEFTAELKDDTIVVTGGAIYEPPEDIMDKIIDAFEGNDPDIHRAFVVKCENCYATEPKLYYQPCEVYSRVVGYLRPVSSWNAGKQAEFKDRRMFKQNE